MPTKIKDTRGFTLVELIIVIVVIGILAAIILVAYSGVTANARESAAKSDLSNFYKKLAIYKARNGEYPSSAAEMKSLGLHFNHDAFQSSATKPYTVNLLYCRYDNNQGYVLQSFTANGTKLFISSKSSAPREYTGADTYIKGGWDDSCWTHSTTDSGDSSVVEPDFEEFTTWSGGLTGSGSEGTSDYGVTAGYFNSTKRADPKWHAWTNGGS